MSSSNGKGGPGSLWYDALYGPGNGGGDGMAPSEMADRGDGACPVPNTKLEPQALGDCRSGD